MKLAIHKLKDSTDLSMKMQSDLNSISTILKSDDPTNFSTITFPSTEKMRNLFNKIYTMASSENKSTQQLNHKLLRRYLFLIDRYKENIWPAILSAEFDLLNDSIKKLSETLGVIPSLNHPVIWADQKFLPPEINRKTKKRWQKQVCKKPHRGQTVAENGIHFIGIPRMALKESYSSASSIEHIETHSGSLYLNLIDFDYYKLGMMDADHLLASSSLIHRIQEMIEAMNDDPLFAREQKNSIFNDNYFITESDGTIVGNYWLYMAYHNSIENLWLLLASDNSEEKGADDPIDWLSHLEIGQKYLRYLAESGQHIDKSDILYRVSNSGMSVSLKDSFTSWVKESHKHQLVVYQRETKLHHKIRKHIADAGDSKESLMEAHGNLIVVDDNFFYSDTDSQASSFTSINSSDFEQHFAEFSEALACDATIKGLTKDTKKRINEVGSETKQNIKKKRFGI